MYKQEESEEDTIACNSTVPNFFICLLFYKYFSFSYYIWVRCLKKVHREKLFLHLPEYTGVLQRNQLTTWRRNAAPQTHLLVPVKTL